MTPEQMAFVKAMGDLAENEPGRELTPKQDKWLRDLAYHFRRQMPIDLVLHQEPHAWSMLQWMAPELARMGLLRNEPWVPEHAAQAVDLYPKNGPQTAAALWAALHRYALDYLRQAPVIALAICKGSTLGKATERKHVAGLFAPKLKEGVSLRALMKEVRIPYPLRKISGYALHCNHWKAIKQFKRVNTSSIAQMIPKEPVDQCNWLNRLFAFDEHLRRRTFAGVDDAKWDKLLPQAFEWAAWNLSDCSGIVDTPTPFAVTELCDYLAANPDHFNPRWTIKRMTDEAREWHRRIATASAEERFFAEFHRSWDEEIDYRPLPAAVRIEQYTFTALQSAKALFEEGQAMHHCVGSYAADVIRGTSRLYAITETDTGRKIATLEFTTNKWRHDAATKTLVPKYALVWKIAQCKGPCNEAPSVEIGIAASKVLARINNQPAIHLEPTSIIDGFLSRGNAEARVIYP